MDGKSIEEYILKHSDSEPEVLQKISRDARVRLIHGDMVSGHLQGRMLKMLAQMINPKQILELGTFIGYSALCFAEALNDDGIIHSVEVDDELEDIIRKNLSLSPHGEKVKLYIGDALDIIDEFENDSFELVFIDANKRLYWDYFEKVLPKIKTGGFILADNTLWYGKILDQVKSNDWQTKAILEFNDRLSKDQRVEKVILPIRDGITLIRKK